MSWQAANEAWWEAMPMRYDWRKGICFEPGTPKYFTEIDKRFFSNAWQFLPWKDRPFDQLIPYEDLPHLDVLEIGVGQGSHAQLIAARAKSFTGIDLTEAARSGTARRLEAHGIPAKILRMDAEEMAFLDASFDFIWSWGVIHHTADTRRALKEMSRVLRPGGRATVMVYHRNWWNYYVVGGFLRGVLQGQLKEKGDLHRVAQGVTDGAIARYYRRDEWRDVVHGLFDVEDISIYGPKSDVIPIPAGKVKSFLERAVPSVITRTMTNSMRMGSFLVARMRKASVLG